MIRSRPSAFKKVKTQRMTTRRVMTSLVKAKYCTRRSMKNDGLEGVDLSALFPGVLGKAGFEAGLREEFIPGPAVFHGDLRQEQAPPAALGDVE